MGTLTGFMRALMKIMDEKGLTTAEQVVAQLVKTGAFADLCEAASQNRLTDLDRQAHRRSLGLPRLSLKLVRRIDRPATGAFSRDDFFRLDNPDVKFGYLDPNLEEIGEESVSAEGPCRLSLHALLDNVAEEKLWAVGKKTTLADLKTMISRQPKGEKGDLLTNGQANIFFIGDRIVYVFLGSNGWHVEVYPLSGALGWREGSQLISRN